LLAVIIIVGFSTHAQYPKLLFKEVIQKADIIFIGTVDKQECFQNKMKTMIYTDVTFSNLEIISVKNNSPNKNVENIKLTYAGGHYNGKGITVSDQPSFEINHRYLIFLNDDKLYVNPIVGASQGIFLIEKEGISDDEIILNYSGKKVIDFNENDIYIIPDKNSIYDGLIQNSATSSNSESDAILSDFFYQKSNISVKKSDFVNFIKTHLKKTHNSDNPNNAFDGGYFYKRDKNGVIVFEKITDILLNELKYSNNNLQNGNCESNCGLNYINDFSKHGTLGYCGYHQLNFVMKQVPTSYWTYNIYNANMSDWNSFMSVFYYTASDGYFGSDNGTNEFVNFINNTNLSSIYGSSWNGALGLCFTYWSGSECGRIDESDVMFNSSYSWTDDPDFALNNTSVNLLAPISMHEIGHSWGYQRGSSYPETYAYDVLSVMHGGYYNIYETGRGIHRKDAYSFRRNYQNQTSIKSTIDIGVESYWADPNISSFNLRPSTTNQNSYYPGNSITLKNVTVENMSYSAVSNLRICFYLSSNTTISTSDYQLGGSDQYWYWSTFNAESWNTSDYTTTIPSTIPSGTYYVGAIVTVNGFNNDGFTANNKTYFTQKITILQPSYTVSTAIYPSSSGYANGSGTYLSGSTATVTAYPYTGFYFSKWTNNGTQVSTNPSYTFTVSSNTSLIANFVNSSSIEDNENKYSFTTFPNPVYENVIIEFTLLKNSEVIIELYDISGKKQLLFYNDNAKTGNNRLELNINKFQLSSGLYMLKATIDNNTVLKKIFKQ